MRNSVCVYVYVNNKIYPRWHTTHEVRFNLLTVDPTEDFWEQYIRVASYSSLLDCLIEVAFNAKRRLVRTLESRYCWRLLEQDIRVAISFVIA